MAVLHAIDEGEFRGFSSGCRPGRRPHDALEAVTVGSEKRHVHWVLEADIRGCFEAIDHAWLVQCIAHRLGDQRVVRHRQKWRHAGVLAEGQGHAQEEGPPQGGRVSPLAANSSLHDVLDVWADRWRRQYARGEVISVRYGDDCIVGFAYRDAAERFWRELQERFEKCTWELHPEKTRLSECGRYAADRRQRRGQGNPATCDLLGFTHTCRTTRKGKCTVRRKTIAQRLRKQLPAVKDTRRRRLHGPMPPQGAWLHSVLLGHYRYYGVPRNGRLLRVFRDTIMRSWCQTRRRRSQRHRMTWTPSPSEGCRNPTSCIRIPRNVCASRPEAGARCGSAARRDLCGGCWVTGIPTATIGQDIASSAGA